MKFHLLFCSCCSASFELDNSEIYYSKKVFDVYLDSKKILGGVKTNVFSIYNLEPNKKYEVKIDDDIVSFSTLSCSVTFSISEFEKQDEEDDTLRIQTAISILPDNGRLVFEKGTYFATTLFLKSHITLEFKKGAVLKGNPHKEAYPLFPGEKKDINGKSVQFLTWEGAPFPGKASLLSGFYCEDIKLVGEGEINGMGEESSFWEDVKNLKWARPRVLYFVHCRGIDVQGLHIRNSPSWTIHPYFSSNLGFYDLLITNPKDAPNTDGLNPECCTNVSIIGVHFSVGDDCIAIKSGKLYIGKMYDTPSSHVIIRNCYMHEGHGAIVLGSEAGAGLRDITVERCLFEHTDRGMRIKSRRGRGSLSVMDGIVFRDIKMINVLTPLVINMFYFCDPDGKEDWVQDKKPHPVDGTTPKLGSFRFERFECLDAEWAFGLFYGLPEAPIDSITIKDSVFTMKKDASKGYPAMMCGLDKCSKKGFLFTNVTSVSLENVKTSGYEGEEEVLNHVSSFKKT